MATAKTSEAGRAHANPKLREDVDRLQHWDDGKNYQTLLNESHAKITELQGAVKERDTYIQDLEQQLEAGQRRINDILEKLKQREQSVTDREKRTEQYKSEIIILQEKISEYKTQLDAATQKLKEHKPASSAVVDTSGFYKRLASIGLLLYGILLLVLPLIIWLFGLVPSRPPCDLFNVEGCYGAIDPSSANVSGSLAGTGRLPQDNPVPYFILFVIAYVTLVGLLTLLCLRTCAAANTKPKTA